MPTEDHSDHPGINSQPSLNRISHLTTICVNVRDRVVCLSVVRYLLLDRLRYGNMNGTMLSQIVRGMF